MAVVPVEPSGDTGPESFARAWARRLTRGLAICFVGLLATMVIFYLRIRGQLHETLGPVGPQLQQAGLLQDLLDREQPISSDEGRTLVINGQRFTLGTESYDAPVGDALAEFMTACPTGSQMGEPMVGPTHGYAICARAPEGSDEDLATRIQAFGETSDIGRLGRIEYAYAVAGETGKTSVLHLSSTDALELDELVPLGGRDAIGSDPADFPRPPDGGRVLHSFEEGLPYAYYVYGRSEKSADELRAWYRANVDQTIWTELDIAAVAEERGETASEDSLFFARREDLTRYVVVELRERPPHELRPGRTMVAIAEAQ
ncbi:MAG: hypothetical protein CMN30_33080 [Sandaracinus sp.]|nr:hypothetical protein [Sandaracinus sp.]